MIRCFNDWGGGGRGKGGGVNDDVGGGRVNDFLMVGKKNSFTERGGGFNDDKGKGGLYFDEGFK